MRVKAIKISDREFMSVEGQKDTLVTLAGNGSLHSVASTLNRSARKFGF